MTETAFGFDPEQDRLWLMYAPDQPRLWITRRIAQGIASLLTQLVEDTAPGFVSPQHKEGQTPAHSATMSAAQRVQIEHRLAVTETPDGRPNYPYQIKTESKAQLQEHGFALCKSLNAHIDDKGGHITLLADDLQVKFDFNRYDLHLWLRAFRMALSDAHWNFHPPLPAWLDEPLLPPSIQKLLAQPLPTDLDDDAGDDTGNHPHTPDTPPHPPKPDAP